MLSFDDAEAYGMEETVLSVSGLQLFCPGYGYAVPKTISYPGSLRCGNVVTRQFSNFQPRKSVYSSYWKSTTFAQY